MDAVQSATCQRLPRLTRELARAATRARDSHADRRGWKAPSARGPHRLGEIAVAINSASTIKPRSKPAHDPGQRPRS